MCNSVAQLVSTCLRILAKLIRHQIGTLVVMVKWHWLPEKKGGRVHILARSYYPRGDVKVMTMSIEKKNTLYVGSVAHLQSIFFSMNVYLGNGNSD